LDLHPTPSLVPPEYATLAPPLSKPRALASPSAARRNRERKKKREREREREMGERWERDGREMRWKEEY
jgi:hypothetical protein